MLSNVIVPTNVVELIIAAVLLALLLVPRLAENTMRFFVRVRDAFFGFARGLGTLIKRIWARDDFLAQRREVLEDAVREEVAKRRAVKGRGLLTEEEMEDARTSVYQTYNVTQEQLSAPTSSRLAKANNALRQERVNRAIRAEVQRQRNQKAELPLTDGELAEVRRVVDQTYGGEDPEVSGGLIAQAWVRRIIYLLLALVCVGADYVLVSTRAPILFGGGDTPPFLKSLFSYLQIITGVLFVSAAALSGMLIQENSRGLSPIVRIEPDIGSTEKRLKLILAISMIVIDVIVVIFLTVGGVFQQYLQTQDLEVIYVVFVGTSVLIAIGIFLAFTGLYQAIQGLGALVVGAVLGLPSLLLGAVFGLIVAILALFDQINRAIFRRKKKPVDIYVPEESRNLSVIGFGTWGSAVAVNICQELAKIYGSYAWLAGVYAPTQIGGNQDDQDDQEESAEGAAGPPDKQLKATQVAAHYVSVPATLRAKQAADDLVAELVGYYGNNKPEAEKPLLWVVNDLELESCMAALTKLGAMRSIKGLRLALVWRVPQAITTRHKALAGKLLTWASAPESMLTTTLVLEEAAPLAKNLINQGNPALARSLASLLATDRSNRTLSFATIIGQLQTAGFPFSALQAGSVGIAMARQAFSAPRSRGPIVGMKGEVNPRFAAGNTQTIAQEAFDDQTLSTVTDKWPTRNANPAEWERLQHEVFVNIIVPSRLGRDVLLKAYKDDTSGFLAEEFSVAANQVTYTALRDDNDKGIVIGGVNPILGGDAYIHFTVLRGVGKGVGNKTPDDAAPEILRPIITDTGQGANGTGGQGAPVSQGAATDSR